MLPRARVQAAFRAMKDLGISEQKTKPVLTKLVKLYDKNWQLIEEENYRVLADAIFEQENTEAAEQKNMSQSTDHGEVLQEDTRKRKQAETERPFKRLRFGYLGQDPPLVALPIDVPGECSLKKPKDEPLDIPEACLNQQPQKAASQSASSRPINKGKQPVSHQSLGVPERSEVVRRQMADRAQTHVGIHIREKENISAAPASSNRPDSMHLKGALRVDHTAKGQDKRQITASKSGNGLDNGTNIQVTVQKNPPADLEIAATPMEELSFIVERKLLSSNMPPSARVQAALRAMKDLGISEQKTNPVLKKLVKLYDKNWQLIEEENYRVLADAIFEQEDTEMAEQKNMSQSTDCGEVLQEDTRKRKQAETERPLKRLRLRYRGQDPPSVAPPIDVPGECSLKRPKDEPLDIPEACLNQQPQRSASQSASPLPINKGKQPVSHQSLGVPERSEVVRRQMADRAQPCVGIHIREKEKENISAASASSNRAITGSLSLGLITPKDEPFTEDMPYEVPLAIIPPDSMHQKGTLHVDHTAKGQDKRQITASKSGNGLDNGLTKPVLPEKEQTNIQVTVQKNPPADLEIAATPMGEVKLSLSYNSVEKTNFQPPSLDDVIKYLDEKCIRTYKILDSSFSVAKLMKEFCDSFLELGSASAQDSQGMSMNQAAVADAGSEGTSDKICSLNRSLNAESCGNVVPTDFLDPSSQENKESAANEKALVVAEQHQIKSDNQRGLLDPDDVTGGSEKVKIPLLKEQISEVPPSFCYICQSIVYQNADVKICLAQISDEDCCPNCSGDCVPLSMPCACTCRNGGQFAYTSDGLLKEEFLEECISMVQKNHLFYCKECPLERCKKEDMLEPCKGHMRRKFIKECWNKCGCSKHCVNRVVQQGISSSLQIFLTPEGKGWGLRTLEDLPKGTFLCEYVGEILTVNEFQQRSEKHSYSVLLDAEWGSSVQKDEQALCLDATNYGNVARFINHRCLDANLIEIPVEVDTPEHHYYRVALFTTRKVYAFEELTRDYGFDFDDDNHFEAFRCLCGSDFCRNMKRASRSRSSNMQ